MYDKISKIYYSFETIPAFYPHTNKTSFKLAIVLDTENEKDNNELHLYQNPIIPEDDEVYNKIMPSESIFLLMMKICLIFLKSLINIKIKS